MARLKKADITDDLLLPQIADDNNSILADCDNYLNYLASIYDKTLADIPVPLPYQVKELAKAWVGRRICADKSSGAPAGFVNQQPGDKWTAKLPYYQGLVEKYESAMQEKILFGTKPAESIGTIRIGRS